MCMIKAKARKWFVMKEKETHRDSRRKRKCTRSWWIGRWVRSFRLRTNQACRLCSSLACCSARFPSRSPFLTTATPSCKMKNKIFNHREWGTLFKNQVTPRCLNGSELIPGVGKLYILTNQFSNSLNVSLLLKSLKALEFPRNPTYQLSLGLKYRAEAKSANKRRSRVQIYTWDELYCLNFWMHATV